MLMNFEDLGAYKRGRVWLNEYPHRPYRSKGRVDQSFPLKSYTYHAHCALTIELVLAARMVSNYANIGVSYFPSDNGVLVVQAEIGFDDDLIVDDVIALQPDVIKCGIPEEYIHAVIDEIQKLSADPDVLLPSGRIVIDTGAHGLVGSSPVSFRQAINVLLQLLTLEDKTAESVQDKIVDVLHRVNQLAKDSIL
ncbi:hypothetical protein [Paenibacillus pedocola]|uniref:hypothetical protein n=1 Tax=Paenibacillus pedocola TaxID=3242193 RepID=UPI002877617A|nr:hypothetical protein [Paenibacillus typhae]